MCLKLNNDNKKREDFFLSFLLSRKSVDCSNLDDAPKNIAEALFKESRRYLY